MWSRSGGGEGQDGLDYRGVGRGGRDAAMIPRPCARSSSRRRSLARRRLAAAGADASRSSPRRRPRRRPGRVVLETGVDYMASEPNFLTGRPAIRLGRARCSDSCSPRPTTSRSTWSGWPRGRARRSRLRNGPTPATSRCGRRCASSTSGPGARRSGRALRGDAAGDEGRRGARSQHAAHGRRKLLLRSRLGRAALHANAGLAIHDEVQRPHAQNDFLAYGARLHAARRASRRARRTEVAGHAGKGTPGGRGAGRGARSAAIDAGRVSGTPRSAAASPPPTAPGAFTAGLLDPAGRARRRRLRRLRALTTSRRTSPGAGADEADALAAPRDRSMIRPLWRREAVVDPSPPRSGRSRGASRGPGCRRPRWGGPRSGRPGRSGRRTTCACRRSRARTRTPSPPRRFPRPP